MTDNSFDVARRGEARITDNAFMTLQTWEDNASVSQYVI